MSGRRVDEVAYSRRRFLAGAGVVAGAVVAGRSLDVWGHPMVAGAAPQARLTGVKGRTVVFVELAGGNDGIGTVVPHADPGYRRLRPTLAVDPIDLDGSVGLHPSLARLAERFRAGHVAIVEGVGYPNNDLSHFASLANWWTAQPGTPGTTGWLGRYLDATVGYDDPLAGVVIGPGPSPALLGERSFATSISDASGLDPRLPPWITRPDTLVDAWAGFASERADRSSVVGQVRESVGLTVAARRDLERALTASAEEPTTPAASSAYADGTAVESFDLAARLVTAKKPPKVIYVTNLGDYDTHQGQATRQADLLRDLDGGLDRFFTMVEAAGVTDKVMVMTLSEFGRRAQENGSGTDHGNAGAHFIVGSRVKGGRYGQPTALATLDARGNLPFAVDFRSMYATALEGWLGVEAEPILGKGFAPQRIFV